MEIGSKIKALRTQYGLTQEELANRCELSKGFISQLENDLTSPSIATLIDILQVFGTDLNEFFSDSEKKQIVFTEEDMFKQETDEMTIKWLVPNAQTRDMEPILVSLKPTGETTTYPPHEHEVFGYVLKGEINLYIGDRKRVVHAGESFYYVRPGKAQVIKNESENDVEFLWVSTPPTF
jgi:transcriptional regulator with XRE-family HTH domain